MAGGGKPTAEGVGMNELVEAVQKAARREVAQALRQAAAAVDGEGKGRKAAGRNYGRVGFRHRQVVDLLGRHPEGLSARDIAGRCGMQGTQVYGVLKRLQRDGRVKRRGEGYVAA